VKKLGLISAVAVSFCALSLPVLFGQVATPEKRKPLTVEAMFAPGGLTGRGPETLEWSPDGTKLTFVQRDDEGEHGELW
jgi:hypothetical protein